MHLFATVALAVCGLQGIAASPLTRDGTAGAGRHRPQRLVPKSHLVHETRANNAASRWRKRDQLSPDSWLPVRIGLRQSNLETAHELLMRLSHPDSPEYGQHMSAKQIIDHFAPQASTVEAVRDWVVASGIPRARIVQSTNKQWLAFDATVDELEHLLYTDYFIFQHIDTGITNVAADAYHVPAVLREHVDYITPGVKLLSRGYGPETYRRAKRELSGFGHDRRSRRNIVSEHTSTPPSRWMGNSTEPPTNITTPDEKGGGVGSGLQPGSGAHQWNQTQGTNETTSGGKHLVDGHLVPDRECTGVMTFDCIMAMYGMPPRRDRKVNESNKLGVFQDLQQHYSQEDLDLFFATFYPEIPNGTHPELRSINGAIGPAPSRDEAGLEANIDFMAAYAIVWPQQTVLWQMDDEVYQAEKKKEDTKYIGFYNNLWNAMDGSYCTFSAFGLTGNCEAPECLDPSYPNPDPAGYQGDLMCGVYEPTNVISISYAGAEVDLPAAYQERQCLEILKLALQGVTVVVASGDDGIASYRGDPTESGCIGQEETVFNPLFIATCPYVLAVGATKLVHNPTKPGKTKPTPTTSADASPTATPTTSQSVGPEQAEVTGDRVESEFAESGATSVKSGGGFSNIFPMPDYQRDHVLDYLARAELPFGGYEGGGLNYSHALSQTNATNLRFNKLGRAYPDVSTLGDGIAVVHQGLTKLVAGTSLSAPIFAGMLTVINDERINRGKRTVGFVHPALYAHPEVFNDITSGDNGNFDCLLDGFHAIEGWDPVYGLGSPDFKKLEALLLSLP